MCGRFSLIDGTKTIEHRFGGKIIHAEFETSSGAPSHPIYNAAPSMMLPIVVDNFNNSGRKELVMARWGLQLTWRTDFKPQANARLDTVKERKMFRDAYANRHCLVPANLFYEWRRERGIKQPYAIKTTDNELFAMAGIWERGHMPEDPPTFALLTTEANEMMSKIHDRMPVILERTDENRWLKAVGGHVIHNVSMRYPSAKMTMYPVSTKVNRVSYNEPDAIKRINEPTLGL